MTRGFASTIVILVALVLGAVLPRVAFATPSLDACTGVLHRTAGTATTITVAAPGIWCLDQDMVESVDVVGSTFTMITVDSDDVTIDCRGHRLVYTGTADFVNGIRTYSERQRVTVRNCHLYGFSQGIKLLSDGFLIEDNTISASRKATIDSISTSISGGGSGGIIRRNRIYDAVNRAIYTIGSSQVLDNLVDGITRPPTGLNLIVAIDVWEVDGAEVRGNTVRGLPTEPGSANAVQIDDGLGASTRRTLVVDNVFVHDNSESTIGVSCSGGNVLVTDNIFIGFYMPALGCATVVDNDISP
jgi:hypothetical protein